MKKEKLRKCMIILFAIMMMTACGTADINDENDRGEIFDVNDRGDTPLRDDPEHGDRDNNILDADRDDTIIDDEDIDATPNGR